MAEIKWEPDAKISFRIENGSAVLSANRAGLHSLAQQFDALAQDVPGAHIHYDAWNSLEEGSEELVVELIPGSGTQEN